MTKLVKTLIIGGSSTAVAGGAAAGVAVAVTHKKEDKAVDKTSCAVPSRIEMAVPKPIEVNIPQPVAQQKPHLDVAKVVTQIIQIANMDKTSEEYWKSTVDAIQRSIDFQNELDAQAKADELEQENLYTEINILDKAKTILMDIIKNHPEVSNNVLSALILKIEKYREANDDAKRLVAMQELADAILAAKTFDSQKALSAQSQIPAEPVILIPQKIYNEQGVNEVTKTQLALSNPAGNVIAAFKTRFLEKYSMNDLKSQTDLHPLTVFGHREIYSFENSKNIQNLIRETLIEFFPSLRKDINEIPETALFHGEAGHNSYGTVFGILGYLLNDNNVSARNFADMKDANIDVIYGGIEHFTCEYNNYPEGNSVATNNMMNRHEIISKFFKKLDQQIFSHSAGDNMSQETFAQDVNIFAPTVSDSNNIKSAEWVKNAKGLEFVTDLGTRFKVLSAKVENNDITKVDVEMIAFGNEYTVPKLVTKTISNFKSLPENAFEKVFPKLKEIGEKATLSNVEATVAEVRRFLDDKYGTSVEIKTLIDSITSSVHKSDFYSNKNAQIQLWYCYSNGKGLLKLLKDSTASSFAEMKSKVNGYIDTNFRDTVNKLLDLLDIASKA